MLGLKSAYIATKARMLRLPASVKAPTLAETGGLAVSQLLPPCEEARIPFSAHIMIGPQPDETGPLFLLKSDVI